jgi:hypothetical protein
LALSKTRYKSLLLRTRAPSTLVMMSPRTRRPYSSRDVPRMPARHAGPPSRDDSTRMPLVCGLLVFVVDAGRGRAAVLIVVLLSLLFSELQRKQRKQKYNSQTTKTNPSPKP